MKIKPQISFVDFEKVEEGIKNPGNRKILSPFKEGKLGGNIKLYEIQ